MTSLALRSLDVSMSTLNCLNWNANLCWIYKNEKENWLLMTLNSPVDIPIYVFTAFSAALYFHCLDVAFFNCAHCVSIPVADLSLLLCLWNKCHAIKKLCIVLNATDQHRLQTPLEILESTALHHALWFSLVFSLHSFVLTRLMILLLPTSIGMMLCSFWIILMMMSPFLRPGGLAREGTAGRHPSELPARHPADSSC